MKKGDRFTIEIVDLSREGEGFGRIEGMAVFIPGTIPGDTIEAELTEAKKSFGRAKMTKLLAPSDHRTEPFCRYAKECGGCNMQHINYEGQLAIKEKWVKDALVRIGGMEEPNVATIIEMAEPFRYRNKAQFPVGRTSGAEKKEKACRIGVYKEHSNEVVDCKTCMIQAEPVERIVEAVRRWVKLTRIPIYDPKTGTGVLRHVVVKTAFGTGEVMVAIVTTDRRLPNTEYLMTEICKELADLSDEINAAVGDDGEDYGFYLESLIINVNKKKTREVMGHECITAAGKPTISDYLFGMEFEISPLSFYQVNPIQTERLYAKAAEYADLTGAETVLDLYCGVGTIGLVLAGKAKKVIGIETVKAAVLDANRNATLNGIVNAEFVCGKAEDELPRLLAEGLVADVVILDPPRSGCDVRLLNAVAQAAPARIVYVSCDPATMSRDIKQLTEDGYQLVEAQPVDVFPHTGHVETVVLMSRAKE